MTSLLPYVTGSAGAIVVLFIFCYLFYQNKLHSDKEFHRVLRSYEEEREAHERTRQALAVADARAEAGLKPAEIIAAVLQSKKD